MQLYLVAIIENPTVKQAEDGDVPKIVVQPTGVLATDERQAAMKAMRLLDSNAEVTEDRLEVKVLPFCTARTTC